MSKYRLLLLVLFALTGCSTLPDSGPSRHVVEAYTAPAKSDIQLIDVTESIAQQLVAQERTPLFSQVLGNAAKPSYGIGPGDVLQFSIWEVPPATLFAPESSKADDSASIASHFPEQTVSSNGTIDVPFAGQIQVAGLNLQQIEHRIERKLKYKANQPQVLVKLVHNTTANVTIVGDVAANIRMPLTPSGEHLLDAIATAGGAKQPITKTTVQITRGHQVYSLPLDTIIRDPNQNILLEPGDVITVLYQPLSFIALGATGKNEEINFESSGITVAQALGRAAGLQDNRADAKAVYIFRLESPSTLHWAKPPVLTPDGKVAVIYRIDLMDPHSFFVVQSFPVKNKDILYVSNASMVQLQKLLSIFNSLTVPAWNVTSSMYVFR